MQSTRLEQPRLGAHWPIRARHAHDEYVRSLPHTSPCISTGARRLAFSLMSIEQYISNSAPSCTCKGRNEKRDPPTKKSQGALCFKHPHDPFRTGPLNLYHPGSMAPSSSRPGRNLSWTYHNETKNLQPSLSSHLDGDPSCHLRVSILKRCFLHSTSSELIQDYRENQVC
jgi:hypothetical protein